MWCCVMMIPVRCFTCGSLIGDKYERFLELIDKGVEPKAALDELGLKRYCCRRMILSHIDIIDDFIVYRRMDVGRGEG